MRVKEGAMVVAMRAFIPAGALKNLATSPQVIAERAMPPAFAFMTVGWDKMSLREWVW